MRTERGREVELATAEQGDRVSTCHGPVRHSIAVVTVQNRRHAILFVVPIDGPGKLPPEVEDRLIGGIRPL
ncbi:hypothetical protein HJ590_16060 [Naumannella sp. ID2617S]|nr:hypothetical protein [Naumannella sp. ID2617S]